ncbi:MAG TPA: hypothetical protein VGB64_02645 [Actinomycetota bacterium]
MRYEIGLAGRILRPEGAEAWLDEVMASLASLPRADPAIGGSMADGEIEIAITVEGDGIEPAITRATSLVRDAMNSAGAGNDAVVWERLVATTAVAAPAR